MTLNAAINPEIYAAIQTEAPTAEIDIAPEIFAVIATATPKAEIDIQPEIWATIYSPPKIVRISGGTARTLKKTESASADSLRQIANSIEVSGDSSRKIRATVNVTGDTTRAVKIEQAISGDSRRSITITYTIGGNTHRTVKSTQFVTGDTARDVFKFEPQIVRISGAVARKVTRAEFVTADTFSRMGVQNAATGATRRVVRFDVLTSISLDTARKIVKTSIVTADTVLCVTRFERATGDALRQLGSHNFLRADSVRQVKKFIRAVGDTRLAYGISQIFTADTFRRLNYHVWKVDETGAVIQLNRPRGNHILIGSIKTLSVSNWRVIPDDRQRKIDTIGGVIVEDFGHVTAGDKISCTVTLDAAGANILGNYWHNRVFVNVVDEAGRIWENLRCRVKSYGYIPHFPNYYRATIEFWKE